MNNNLLTITGAGTIIVKAGQPGNANYAAASDVPRTITVGKATAAIALDVTTLNQTYDGTPKTVSATTTPTGLNTSMTYNGSITAPTATGSYSITATITDGNFIGSTIGTLNITPANFVVQIPGDCDANGTVTISEAQSALNMFLGIKSPASCVDLDGDNTVSIGEAQKVINGFLGL